MDAGKDGHAPEADNEPREARAADSLARREAKGQQEVEQRNGCVRDRSHAGVDVALAPRDEGERRRSVDRAEDESRDGGGA